MCRSTCPAPSTGSGTASPTPGKEAPMTQVIESNGMLPVTSAEEELLALDGISAGYGTSAVLRNVTLTVPKGTMVALLGANGAGKTTLLRVASGLLRPTAGEVRLGATAVTR